MKKWQAIKMLVETIAKVENLKTQTTNAEILITAERHLKILRAEIKKLNK